MTTTIKAAVNRALGAPLTVETVTLDAPGPGEVEVRIRACAICHSDIIFIDGGWGDATPSVWGHEAAGEVARVGAGVAEFAPGDRVVVTLIRACGTCVCCEAGHYGICAAPHARDARSPLTDASGAPLGHGLKVGGFAERAVVDRSQIAKIEGEIGWAEASLLACGVITGYGAVTNVAHMRPGATVVVIGAGGVGLNAVQGAALEGASRVIAVDVSAEKLEFARAFGATDCVNAGREDAVAAVRRLAPGGADFVFATVGAPRAIEQAYPMLAPGGAAVLVGIPATGATSTFDPVTLASSAQRILGAKMGGADVRRDIPALIRYYQAGRLKLDELVTGRFGLGEINDALDLSRRGVGVRNVILFD